MALFIVDCRQHCHYHHHHHHDNNRHLFKDIHREQPAQESESRCLAGSLLSPGHDHDDDDEDYNANDDDIDDDDDL